MTVYWTNEALANVAEIRDYLLATAPNYAETIVASFFDKAEQLIDFPKMGRLYRKGELPQTRELLIGTY